MKEVTLPSGAVLRIDDAPFEESLALFEAILAEGKTISFSLQAETTDFIKSVFCTLLPSKKVKACLSKCMDRALYNDLRISSKTWDHARGDYLPACIAVAEENVSPFAKSLSVQFATVLSKLESVRT